MWLLDWLLNRWALVSDWFSSSYWTARALIFSIPAIINLLILRIQLGYYDAVNAITGRLIDFYNTYIVPAINAIRNELASHGGIIGYLRFQFDNFVTNIENKLTTIRNGIIAWAIATYNNWILSIEIKINTFIATHLQSILSFVNFVNKYNAWLDDVTKRIQGFELTNLVKDFNATKNIVIPFASNPIGFILGLLWQNGITFICYLLGYGLGTVKYNLPSKPNWSGSTGNVGGEVIPFSGVLGNPVNHPYISGYSFSSSHLGVDLGITKGETIFAAHDGKVIYAEWSSVGYGFCIVIEGNNKWSRYAHLQSFLVGVGDSVTAGQAIALGDSTGNSTGDHLHFELKINGVFVDPLLYLQ